MEIFPSSLFYLTTLNKGCTGNVYLVHNQIYVYVLKAIYIKDYYQSSTFEGKTIPNVLNEKDASKRLDNPFLVNYVKTLKNNNWCFFIMEYINGIKLSEYISMCKPFHSIKFCKFQSACFLLMLEALKQVNFIHRNIKPENIIIEKNGYPKLIDFSFCKMMSNDKTKTLIGTPYYIAPEVLKGKGYSYSCDYWSVGVMIYYLFYGEYPFGKNTNQPGTIYKEIINKEVEFVKISNNKDSDLKEVIIKLLNKDENLRYCSFDKIKDLNFFKGVNFNKLSKQEIQSPFVPEVVKINFSKELRNVRKPFNSFIQNEKIEKSNSPSVNNEIVYGHKHDDFNHHVNLMKWYEKF